MPNTGPSPKKICIGAVLLAASQLVIYTPALAQLDEIIVTAQKREQRALEVPVSLSAFSGDALQRAGITDVRNLFYVAPSVSFHGSVNSAGESLRVRGIGSAGFSNGVEQSVSTILDGVVTGPSGSGLSEMWDIDRVEVLRGPQGTLFGKNVSAGAVNIVSKSPTDEFEASGLIRYGTRYESTRIEGVLNAPITDELRARVSGFFLNDDDGTVDNVFLDRSVNRKERFGIRLRTDYSSGPFSIDVSASWNESDDICCTRTFTRTDPIAVPTTAIALTGANNVTISPRNRQSISSGIDTERTRTGHIAVEAAWEFNSGHILKSITGYRNWLQRDRTDADQLPLNLLDDSVAKRDLRIFSEEIQFLSPTGEKLEYVLGLYYFNQRFMEDQILAGGFGGGVSEQSLPLVKVNNAAVFGQATYNFTEQWSAFLGARLLWEEIEATGSRAGNLPIPAFLNDQFNDRSAEDVDWVGTAGIRYFPTPENMLYFSFSRGYKGHAIDTSIGGPFFTSTSLADPVLDPETVISFELGSKNSFLDGRLTANLVGFYSRFKDFQASAFDGTSNSFVFRNAGIVEVMGLELDLVANPWEGATLTAGGAWVDGEFVEYEGAPCTVGQTAAATCSAATGGQDLSGEKLNENPEFQFSITARQEYILPNTNDWRVYAFGSFAWRDDVVFDGDLDPSTTQKAYGVADFQIGLIPNERVELVGFVQNAFNKDYAYRIIDAPLNTGAFASYLAPERTFGVELRLRTP